MANLTADKIIQALPKLSDEFLKEISHATAAELGRREKEIEENIAAGNERLQAIRGNAGQ